MKLLPDNYSVEKETENLLGKAVRFCDKSYDEVNFAVLSSRAFVVCTKGGEDGIGEIYVGETGGAAQTSNTKLVAGPVQFSKGNVSNPVALYIKKPVLRVFFALDGKAKFADFNVLTNEISEVKDFEILGVPYDMYKTLHGKYIMATANDGAHMVELDGTVAKAEADFEIKGYDTAQIATDDNGGYFAFAAKGNDGYILSSTDGKDWKTVSDKYDLVDGKPSFNRLYRLYYIAYNTADGIKIDISKNCKEFETLMQFEKGTDIKNIAFYEWDGIIYYTALLNGKPIYSRLR